MLFILCLDIAFHCSEFLKQSLAHTFFSLLSSFFKTFSIWFTVDVLFNAVELLLYFLFTNDCLLTCLGVKTVPAALVIFVSYSWSHSWKIWISLMESINRFLWCGQRWCPVTWFENIFFCSRAVKQVSKADERLPESRSALGFFRQGKFSRLVSTEEFGVFFLVLPLITKRLFWQSFVRHRFLCRKPFPTQPLNLSPGSTRSGAGWASVHKTRIPTSRINN